jgi:hypothetical protein
MTRSRELTGGTSQAVRLCLFSALAMAYGWGWRGSYGHEAGAMLPGALLGMAICLGSAREDWYRRTPLAGLCGAVGWAWGGALSNMEQTFYVVSDSLPDVLWAFSCIFLVGLLWSGMGSAILSLAVTESRSTLNGFLGPLIANGAALFAVFLLFFFRPDCREAIDAFGQQHLHDSKFLAAGMILIVSSLYWLARPAQRPQSALFVQGAAAWWAGYLALTKFGGILLAPPNRSESWGGFVGVLAVLALYLARRQNRAGLWMTLGGALSGGLAFVLALFLTHPLVVRWGPFAETTITNTWKLTEETFGFFMGLGVAATAIGLLGGNLKPPQEDTADADRANSDQLAAFVLLIVMPWMNLRKNVRDWGGRYDILPHHDIGGLAAWQWFFVVGVVFTGLGLYALYRVRKGTLSALLPSTAFGKGALLFLLVLWIAQVGVSLHRFVELKTRSAVLVEVSYWVLAGLTTWLLLACAPAPGTPSARFIAGRDASDPAWRAGRRYWLLWVSVPIVIVVVAYASMGMQDGPQPKSRLRFGPDAYWRLELERKTGGDDPSR